MLQSFATGLLVSFALIVAIGAQNAFVLRQGLRREHVGAIVAFCAAADAILVVAGVLGLGTALAALPRLALWLSAGGGAFLAVYGVLALRRASRPGHLQARPDGAGLSRVAALAQAAGFTLLNPHVYLDTVMVVGSIGASQPPGGAPAFILGASLASALWFATLGYGARLLAPIFQKPAAWRVLDACVGLTMLTLSAGLVARTVFPG